MPHPSDGSDNQSAETRDTAAHKMYGISDMQSLEISSRLYVGVLYSSIMIRLGTVLVMGGIIGSMVIALAVYALYQPSVIEVARGEFTTVGPVEYSVLFHGIHEGNENFVPENTFVSILIEMRNLQSETVSVSGAQFYIIDENSRHHWPVFGNGTMGPEDLLVVELEPGILASRTTQFDIPYDQDATYKVLVRPAKDHTSGDSVIFCITNCGQE